MDTQKISSSRRWYDKKRFTLPLLIFMFPVGLYALWKGNAFSKGVKIGVSAVFGLFFLLYIAAYLAVPKNQNIQAVDNNLPDRVDMVAEEVTVVEEEGNVVRYDNNGNQVSVVKTEVEKKDIEKKTADPNEKMSGEEFGKLYNSNKKTKWAFDLVQGSKWDFEKIKRNLGDYEIIPVTNYNPKIIEAYYFPAARTTLFRNSYKNELAFTRIGRASE